MCLDLGLSSVVFKTLCVSILVCPRLFLRFCVFRSWSVLRCFEGFVYLDLVASSVVLNILCVWILLRPPLF